MLWEYSISSYRMTDSRHSLYSTSNVLHVCEYMQGFLDIKMKKWTRNLMTRSIAIVPSLVVSIIGGSSGAGRLIIIASVHHFRLRGIIYSIVLTRGSIKNIMPVSVDVNTHMQMILSFELPFALIPLLKFSSSRNKMGQNNNSVYVRSFLAS